MSNFEKLRIFLRRNFTRDLTFSKSALTFSVCIALNIIISTGSILNNTWVINADAFTKGFTIFCVGLSLLVTVLTADKFLKKSLLIRCLMILNTVGMVFLISNNPILHFIGRAISLMSSVPSIVLLIGCWVHESNLLNRGRFAAYNLFVISIFALAILFTIDEPGYQNWLIIPMIFFDFIVLIFNKYRYVESEERLNANVKFRKMIMKYNNWGRFLSYFIIAFVLGLIVLRYDTHLNIKIIYFALTGIVIIAGVLIDNVGRKQVLIFTVILLSIITIFASEVEVGLWNPEVLSIIYGIIAVITMLLLTTYAGDSTRDENRGFRSLIIGGYLVGILGGFAVGDALGVYIMNTYASDPVQFFYYPDLINKIGAFALIWLLVALYPLHDSVHSEDNDWFKSLRQLYIFNENGICLYSYNFWKDVRKLEKMENSKKPKQISEDLVSGGLSGIVSLISEITESNKRLRVVDHEDKKLIFHYGKYAIFCLMSTKYLNILVSKLKDFALEFEDTYEKPLKTFHGATSIFDDANYLINKHFKQRYFENDLDFDFDIIDESIFDEIE